jgi:hypothetical protein
MSKLNFISLCGNYYIDPTIALENDALCDALRAMDDDEVKRILEEEF